MREACHPHNGGVPARPSSESGWRTLSRHDRQRYCVGMSATTSNAEVSIISVADAPWDDVRTVFGTRGDPAGCWCQWFKQKHTDWTKTSPEERSAMLQEQVRECDPPPGLIAYLDEEPVAWCAVEPRTRYSRLRTTKVVSEGSPESWEDQGVWAVTCFVVRDEFRKRGISRALLDAAVEHAKAGGARVVEGYPVDVAAKKKVSAAELYYGALSTFEATGFTLVSRPTSGRAVVQLQL